jgi:hypothetical protein
MLLVAASVTSVYKAPTVHAAQITTRSLTLLANGAVGGSTPAGVVNHKFDFTLPSNTSVGSIKFEYCTIASVTEGCVAPTDLNSSSATFGGESGATGFSIGSATVNTVTIARASATAATGAVSYTLNSVLNPSPANYTFFVRISTFASLDGTGTAIDTGTVAASTANPIQLTGIMPESLIFCTGATIALTVNGDPDCSTATGGVIAFNQLFSPTDTATATSQMAASTNALTGYAITVNGPTLTSGSATIPAMATAATGTKGQSQFGMNLRLNTTATSTVAAGGEITPVSDGGDLRAQALTGYATADTFKFTTGDVVADSGFNTPGPTNAQRYTATYIANVAGNQLAGTYTTTLTYVCTATY